MPRYFFYIVQDGKEIADHEGNEFSGLDEAKSEAVASAKDVARQDIAESRSLKDACIEIRDESGAYRVIYVANIGGAVHVLHAFQKKTQATSKRDLEIASRRYAEIARS